MKEADMMDFYDMEILTYGALDVMFGSLACLTSLVLFLQPLPAFARFCWNKDTRGILPYPYIVAAFSCFYSLMYATPETETIIQFRDFCIICSSVIGMVMANIYILIFWNYSKQISHFKLHTICMAVNIVALAFIPWTLTLESRNSILGTLTVISGTMFYASPVLTIFEALRAKRVEYLPFGFLMASCLNGFVWMIYTLLPSNFDLYLAITNGVGAIFSVAQLGLAYEIQSVIAAIGTAQQTTDCNAHDGKSCKFIHEASTQSLNGSQPETHVETHAAGDSSGGTIVSKVHPSNHLMLNSEVVDRNEATKQQENGMVDDALEIGIKCNCLSLPSRSSFPRGGAIERKLEAKFNELMSYMAVSYFGAALYLEKNMSKMNKDICDIGVQNNKLKEILETQVKNRDGAWEIVE